MDKVLKFLEVLGIISAIAVGGYQSYMTRQSTNADIIGQSPYVVINTTSDNATKSFGIYVKNSGAGVAIIKSIKINDEVNQNLTLKKWGEILKSVGMTEEEINCFAYSSPKVGLPLTSNNGIGLVYVKSNLTENFNCTNDQLLAKLEKNLHVEITYSSRLPDSSTESAIRAKLWE